jgi:hypothetical protein
MAKDVTTFLSWASEPEHDERKKMGLKAAILTGSLFLISIWVKRFKWSPIKNRKLSTLQSWGFVILEPFLTDVFYLTVPQQSTTRRSQDPTKYKGAVQIRIRYFW